MREESLVIPLGLASHWLPVVPEDPINPANTDMSCRIHQQTFVLGKWYTVIGDINDIIKFIHLNKKHTSRPINPDGPVVPINPFWPW